MLLNNATAPIVEVSYDYLRVRRWESPGICSMYQTWQQAAAEGITVVVAAGDSWLGGL
jgi:subtilase family serine protease